MNDTHIISTTDPINGFNITDLKDRPHIVEGDNADDLTIYFEYEASRQTYLDMPVEQPERNLSKTLSNPIANLRTPAYATDPSFGTSY